MLSSDTHDFTMRVMSNKSRLVNDPVSETLRSTDGRMALTFMFQESCFMHSV